MGPVSYGNNMDEDWCLAKKSFLGPAIADQIDFLSLEDIGADPIG